MHRPLALSQSTAFLSNQEWGRPQQETVSDYTVELLDAHQNWNLAVSVTGNFQRRRIHNIESSTVMVHQKRLSVTPAPELSPTVHPAYASAPIGVRVNTCASSSASAQQWLLRSDNRLSLESNQSLCLTVNPEVPAVGGNGPAVYVDLCGGQGQVWSFPSQSSFNFGGISSSSSYKCLNSYSGDVCTCLNSVQPGSSVNPLAAIELWSCTENQFGQIWSYDAATRLLALSISNFYPYTPLCLEAFYNLPPPPPPPTPQPLGPGPFFALRVNVTATNGIPVAHINEIRVYDQDGLSLFPAPN
jgi:hypothetical protein